jgi:hypothetical protein
VRLDEEELHFVIVDLLSARSGGIDHFPIATPDHANSSGFVVWISSRANLEDWVVIDGVPIDSRARLSIGFVVADCLTVA